MSAAAPPATTSSQSYAPPQREKLLTLLTHARRAVIAVALYDRLSTRREIVAAVRERLMPARPVHEVHLSERERNPIDLIRTLKPAEGDVVCLFDLERALPDALGHLDLQRETLVEMGISLIVWVTTYEHRELANRAPNFYAFRTSTFDFTTPAESALPRGNERAFIGRERELARLADALRLGGCVVLSGTGGVGKTALAGEAARGVHGHFVGGVVWIDCESKPPLNDVVLKGAVALVGEFARQMRPDEQRQRLDDVLRDRACLLVLDNFEAVTEDSELLRWLKTVSSSSSVLVVARHSVPYLRAPGLDLEPLPIADAVQLFWERAVAGGGGGNHDRAAIDDLCHLAGCLPLAIELVAPCLAELSADALARLLRQTLPRRRLFSNLVREQTSISPFDRIFASFQVAFNRRSEQAQTLLLRLSAFREGAPSEDVSSLTGISEWREPLAECVRWSMVRLNGDRYVFHPLIRRLALARLLKLGRISEEQELPLDQVNTLVWDQPQQDTTSSLLSYLPSSEVVVIEAPDFDLYTAAQIQRELLQELGSRGPDLWIDLSNVEFVDASGLAALIALAREARNSGGDVHLLNLNGSVRRVLRITGIDQMFDVR